MWEAEKESLACCIVRALQISTSPKTKSNKLYFHYTPTRDNDVYWHTREACAEVAKAFEIKWVEILSTVNQINSNPLPWSEIVERSRMFWWKVAHPVILVEEVMSE